MCWCTPNMRTPCCGSHICHNIQAARGFAPCTMHSREPSSQPPKPATEPTVGDVANQMLFRQAVNTLPEQPALGVIVVTVMTTPPGTISWRSNIQERAALRTVLQSMLRMLEAN